MITFERNYLCIFFSYVFISFSECIQFSSIDNTYQKGYDAYSGERWSECIVQFEESIHLYKVYKSININCRLKCKSQDYESQVELNVEDLKMYERFFHERNCLNKCQKKSFEDIHVNSVVEPVTQFYMKLRKPYAYLHVCYYEMYALPKAASAAYTYLIANPNDETMKNNLKYYVQQPEVDINEVVDLESEDYQVLFKLGLDAYRSKNWGETVAAMEESLKDYLLWENTCRGECDEQIEHGSSDEFVKTVTDIFASQLKCKQQCQDKLKLFEYNSGTEFLADILNHLQISYYRLDRFADAAKAVSSYLILVPDDEDMLENKRIYNTLIDDKAFTEISDILYYFKRDLYEKGLLDFFHNGNDDINSSEYYETILS